MLSAPIEEITQKWASQVATVRVPKPGSFSISNTAVEGSSASNVAVSFVAESRTASGAGASETVTCVIDTNSLKTVATVSNPNASGNAAASTVLSTTANSSSSRSKDFVARFSKVPADKKAAQQNEPFKGSLELFDPASSSILANVVVSNKKHGEVLSDAHLQQLCFDATLKRLYFLVRSSPPKKSSLEDLLSGAAEAEEDQKSDSAEKKEEEWDLKSRYDAGEGYPQLFGTEIVFLQFDATAAAPSAPAAVLTSKPALVTQKLLPDEKHNLSIVGYQACVDGLGVLFCEYEDVVSDHLQRGLLHCFAARFSKQYAVPSGSLAKKELQLGDVVKQLTVHNHPSDSRNKTRARVAYFDFKSKLLDRDRRPHLNCAALCVAELDADLNVRSKKVLVDVVHTPAPDAADGFPGLFPVMGVGDIIWAADGQSIFVSSVRRSAHVVYQVKCPFEYDDSSDEEESTVAAAAAASKLKIQLVTPEKDGCWRLAAVRGSILVATTSSTTSLPRVMVRNLSSSKNDSKEEGDQQGCWTCVWSEQGRGATLAHRTEIRPLPSAPTQGEVLYHSSAATSAAANNGGVKKVVTFVHGGPHSTDVNAYSRGMHLLLEHGYDILSVNYRGSLGFGTAAVQSLLSRVGTQDVSDVIHAAQHEVFSKKKEGEKLFAAVAGGSHGGFLSCHLAGHSSQLFDAAAIRNPVTAIDAMSLATDIEDWCLTEAGAASSPSSSTKSSNMMLMQRASPLALAGDVKIPCLLGIGDKDLRVPPFQGRSWARAVRQNPHRPQVSLIEYPNDSHGLETPTTEAEFAIQTVMWFEAAAKKKFQQQG